jgi:hypothetical protein
MVNEPEIQAFLDRLHRELIEINEQIAVFQNRKMALEEMVSKCEAMFGGDQPEQGAPILPTEQPSFAPSITTPRPIKKRRSKRAKRGKKIWQLIEDLLREAGRNMSFKQIKLASLERGWETSGTNGTKILARALKDKEDTVFVQTAEGTWDLKERIEQREQL